MTAPSISNTMKTDKAFRTLRALLRALRDWRPFWPKYLKRLEQIQVAWFQRGGPDGKSAPADLRAPWLRRRDRGSSNFYAAVEPGNGRAPDITVSAARPRWVWSKNTLRSTYHPGLLEPRRMVILPAEVYPLYDEAAYGRFPGPFVDEIIRRGGKPWDLRSADRALEEEAVKHIVDTVTREVGRA